MKVNWCWDPSGTNVGALGENAATNSNIKRDQAHSCNVISMSNREHLQFHKMLIKPYQKVSWESQRKQVWQLVPAPKPTRAFASPTLAFLADLKEGMKSQFSKLPWSSWYNFRSMWGTATAAWYGQVAIIHTSTTPTCRSKVNLESLGEVMPPRRQRANSHIPPHTAV